MNSIVYKKDLIAFFLAHKGWLLSLEWKGDTGGVNRGPFWWAVNPKNLQERFSVSGNTCRRVADNFEQIPLRKDMPLTTALYKFR